MFESLLVTLLLIIVTLSVLVVVHEGGHFFVARWCGVKVLTFSVGFGKPLYTYRAASGTDYILAAIPLGGYVRMLDSRFSEVPTEQLSQAFDRKALWQRMAIVAAGPMVNLIFAAGLYAVINYTGETKLMPVTATPVVASAAYEAGITAGQRIVSVDGKQSMIGMRSTNNYCKE